MKVICGDDCGFAKVVSVEKGDVVARYGQPSRDHEITSMCWGRPEQEVCVALRKGVVHAYSLLEPRAAAADPSATFDQIPGVCVGLLCPQASAEPDRRLVYCTESGHLGVRLWSAPGTDQTAVQVETPVARAAPHWSAPLVALGGLENDLQVWDYETKTRVFKAKNVAPDELKLRVPIWVTAVAWFGGEPHRLAVVTGYGHLRFYDTRARPRPLLTKTVSEHRLCSVAVAPGNATVYFGDGAGEVGIWDMRKHTVHGKLKGAVGSVRSIAPHPSLPFVAVTGLDRYVRVYHSETRKAIANVYLKQRQNVVLFSAEGPAAVEEAEKERRKVDRTWAALETVSDSDADATDGSEALSGESDGSSALEDRSDQSGDSGTDSGSESESDSGSESESDSGSGSGDSGDSGDIARGSESDSGEDTESGLSGDSAESSDASASASPPPPPRATMHGKRVARGRGTAPKRRR